MTCCGSSPELRADVQARSLRRSPATRVVARGVVGSRAASSHPPSAVAAAASGRGTIRAYLPIPIFSVGCTIGLMTIA